MTRRQAKKILRTYGQRRGWGKAWSIWLRTVHGGEPRRTGRWCPGSPEWRALSREAVNPFGRMRLWWLSFVGDDGQFLGVCQVWAPSFVLATREAHRLGCNPGGQCKGIDAQDAVVPLIEQKYIGVLMDKHTCEVFDALMEEKIRDAGLRDDGGRAHLQTRSTPQ